MATTIAEKAIIEGIITLILNAEDAESVTNIMVGTVFEYLNEVYNDVLSKHEGISEEAAKREAADNTLSNRIKTLTDYADNLNKSIIAAKTKADNNEKRLNTLIEGDLVTSAIDTFNELKDFLDGVTNKDTFLGLLNNIRAEIDSWGEALNKNIETTQEITTQFSNRFEDEIADQEARLDAIAEEADEAYVNMMLPVAGEVEEKLDLNYLPDDPTGVFWARKEGRFYEIKEPQAPATDAPLRYNQTESQIYRMGQELYCVRGGQLVPIYQDALENINELRDDVKGDMDTFKARLKAEEALTGAIEERVSRVEADVEIAQLDTRTIIAGAKEVSGYTIYDTSSEAMRDVVAEAGDYRFSATLLSAMKSKGMMKAGEKPVFLIIEPQADEWILDIEVYVGGNTSKDTSALYEASNYVSACLAQLAAGVQTLSEKKQMKLISTADVEVDESRLTLTEAGKRAVFNDMWNKACVVDGAVYGKYDPAGAPDAEHPYQLNGLWLTYDEAVDSLTMNTRLIYGGEHGTYCGSTVRTNIPYTCTVAGAYFQAFANMKNVEIIAGSGQISGNLHHCFYGCEKLREIRPLILPGAAHTAWLWGCESLETLYVRTSVSLTLEWCPKITKESLKYLIDWKSGSDDITITVHADVWAKLTGQDGSLSIGDKAHWEELVTMAEEKNIRFASA